MKVFKKSPRRINLFKETLVYLSLPPEPVVTRWGTWLTKAIYHATHFESLKKVIFKLEDDCFAITECKKLIMNSRVINSLAYIKANFSNIVDSITELEGRNSYLGDSLEIIEKIRKSLMCLNDEKGSKICKKFETILTKNPGFQDISNFAKILNGEEMEIDLLFSPIDISSFKYAPVTSCDVERSFSRYKAILRDNRCSFSDENLQKYLFINCNSCLLYKKILRAYFECIY